jgi:hypothetical protein
MDGWMGGTSLLTEGVCKVRSANGQIALVAYRPFFATKEKPATSASQSFMSVMPTEQEYCSCGERSDKGLICESIHSS